MQKILDLGDITIDCSANEDNFMSYTIKIDLQITESGKRFKSYADLISNAIDRLSQEILYKQKVIEAVRSVKNFILEDEEDGV
jgi:hypothetical protein